MKIDYDQRLYRTYQQARAISPQTARLWADAVARRLGPGRPRRVLDLGSGTGRFSAVLADRFGCPVVGVEPSEKMRGVARSQNSDPRVNYVAGAAERLPLADGCCDMAWLSMVLHHLTDLDMAARELRRVLLAGARVFIRSSFKGRLAAMPLYDFFPRALAIDEARHPSVERVIETFEACGFRRIALEIVEQTTDPSLREHAARLRLRAISTFEYLSDEEFERGLRAMEEEAARKEGPVIEAIDLLVLERLGGRR